MLKPTEGRAAPESLPPAFVESFLGRSPDPRRDAFTREVLEGMRPVVCVDAETDPRADKELVRTLVFRSILAVPLVVRKRLLGMAMVSTFDESFAFSEEQIELARGIANAVALTVENVRFYQMEQERQEQLQTLLDVATAASSSLDLDEMLRATLDRLVVLVAYASKRGATAEITSRVDQALRRGS